MVKHLPLPSYLRPLGALRIAWPGLESPGLLSFRAGKRRRRYFSPTSALINPCALGLPQPVTRSYPVTAVYEPDLPLVTS